VKRIPPFVFESLNLFQAIPSDTKLRPLQNGPMYEAGFFEVHFEINEARLCFLLPWIVPVMKVYGAA